MKNNNLHKAAAILPPVLLAAAFFMRNTLVSVGNMLPRCLIFFFTGYYCPGCGNTRSVIHLLRGELLLSLRCNPTPLILIIIGIILYAELLFKLSGKNIILLPRKLPFWLGLIALFMVWCVLRNFIYILSPI